MLDSATATNASTEPLRGALLLTGHLRDTCRTTSNKGLRVLAEHLAWCRTTFDVCDVFLHTWDVLDKRLPQPACPPRARVCPTGSIRCGPSCRNTKRLSNTSSWPCVAEVIAWLSPVSVTVERQDRGGGHEEDTRMWNSAEVHHRHPNAASAT
jgi:hypothetical protein